MKKMKKILSSLLIMIGVILLTGGYFIYTRYQENPEQVVPFPYQFQGKSPAINIEAPILIIGDRMGSYFSKFKTELAATISSNLASPIKIQSLAIENEALHRTLHKLKNLNSWPQILIFQGASEEFIENRFEPSEINLIQQNFRRYQDERVETALMLYPWLSRIIYEPIKRVTLPDEFQGAQEISEADYLKKIETELLLFEQQMVELVNVTKSHNALLILTTTPLNLDISPKKVCEFTSTLELEKEIADLRDLLKVNDPKTAYGLSSKLIQQYAGNALLYFIHGQISKRLGYMEEAKKSLKEATAYDCHPWRATAVYNSIIRKVANNNKVILFDFAELVENEWGQSPTFFDELHPQNLYYERGMQQLGLAIKEILKL